MREKRSSFDLAERGLRAGYGTVTGTCGEGPLVPASFDAVSCR
jgi:hypothetical protein